MQKPLDPDNFYRWEFVDPDLDHTVEVNASILSFCNDK
jgi:hypothetical protein